jgi:hypothetical protein
MKYVVLFGGMILMLFSSPDIFAQSDCKVLMVTISANYNGPCKQGLADGKGEASGIDRYNGDFRKGYPDGEGTYIWYTGEKYVGEWKKGLRDGKGIMTFSYANRDSVLSGVWKNDKYIGEKEPDPYVIEYREGVGRVTCMRTGDRPYVEIKFMRYGGQGNIISNLLFQANSGSEKMSSAFRGFEQVDFPFNCRVVFNAPNAFYTATLNCEVRFTINKPGAWTVSISY